MATTQIMLISIAALIVLVVIFYAINARFKKASLLSENVSEQEESEESFPNIQEEESEVIDCEKNDPIIEKEINQQKKSDSEVDNFMMISVHPKPNAYFSDYSFIQTLGSVGLIYGEHKIFHYDVKTDQGIQRLFSVAQLNKPGTFDLDHIETIHCKGLLLFIDLRACRKRTLALDCLLETAYQLAEDLEGVMFEGYKTPWQEDTPRALAQKVETYQKNTVSIFDEITD